MPISKARLAELRKMTDDDIDYSDIPEMTEDDFKRGKIVYPTGWKGSIELDVKFDADVIEWFKTEYGSAYPVYLNAVLRSHMLDSKETAAE